MNQAEIEDRLIDFAVFIIELINDIPNTKSGNYLSGQLVRSGTSPALNYGEARAAESRKDFIHKIQVVLKELRETLIALKIIDKAKLYKQKGGLNWAIEECNELVAIFVKTVRTAKQGNR